MPQDEGNLENRKIEVILSLLGSLHIKSSCIFLGWGSVNTDLSLGLGCLDLLWVRTLQAFIIIRDLSKWRLGNGLFSPVL